MRNSLLTLSLLIVPFTANSALLERLGGLAYYDDEADLTWLADANYAKTSGYDEDGFMNWNEGMAWASDLNIKGVTDWRLPSTPSVDKTCSHKTGAWGCRGSEMGNLYHNVFGDFSNISQQFKHQEKFDLFDNVQQDRRYWSSDVRYGRFATSFSMDSGYQMHQPKTYEYATWAVRSGDVSAVPVPAAAWLFGSGLLGLVAVARRKANA